MRKFCLTMVGLMLCAMLSACQSPQPQATNAPPVALVTSLPTAPSSRSAVATLPIPPGINVTRLPTVPASPSAVTGKAASVCVPRVNQPWSLWRATQQPLAVQAVLADQETVWAGTPFGVFRVDARTGAFTLSLDYQVSGEVTKLFPLGDGHVWAEGERGRFYYDGKAWQPLQITGTYSSPRIWAVDLNGDVWLESNYSRVLTHFRLPGHVPPSQNRPWKATQVQPADVGVDPRSCLAQTYMSGDLSYRTPEECEVLNRWRAGRLEETVNLDADGSIWMSTVWHAPQGGARLFLSHRLLDQSETSLELPFNSVNSVYMSVPDTKHGIWLGTDQGLVYLDGTSLRWITFGLEECAVPPDHTGPDGFVVDSQSKAWMLTGVGVYTLSPGEWTWRPVPDPSQPNPSAARPIQAIAGAPSGGVWATHGYDLFRIGGATAFEPVQPPDPRCFMQSLAADSEFVWCSRTPQSNASMCDLLQFVVSATAWAYHPVPQGYLERVVIGSEGTIYALGPEGLYVRVVMGPRSEFRPIGAKGAELIVADKQGGVWVAARGTGKLWHYGKGRLTPSNGQFGLNELQQIAVDIQNRLWAALNGALLVYDGKSWRSLATPMRQISELASGPDGRIWIVGDIGIAVYDPAADKLP